MSEVENPLYWAIPKSEPILPLVDFLEKSNNFKSL